MLEINLCMIIYLYYIYLYYIYLYYIQTTIILQIFWFKGHLCQQSTIQSCRVLNYFIY